MVQLISNQQSVLGNIHKEIVTDGITINVCPGKEITWQEFLKIAPRYSIALDGLVGGAPQFDSKTVSANFNHHQDVNRLATRSTSGQVQVAIKQGLIDSFSERGLPKLNLYVNDPDQDSCLAVWLLIHHERVSGLKSEPLINKLVFAEDLIDTTAGGYPFDPRSTLMQELAWVFEPYVAARISGRIPLMDGAEMANVINSVGDRINRYTLGQSQRCELDARFEIIGGGPDWQMIKKTGFYARTGLFSQGVRAFVSLLKEDSGTFHYTIGKMSPFVDFPIQDLYMALNNEEGLDPRSGVSWNGGDTIGGSPRRVGSQLAPSQVEKVINGYIKGAVIQ